MASYAQDLRLGQRTALADRYHPDGAYFLGDGEKMFEAHAKTRQYYASKWVAPTAFQWDELSYEPLGSGAILVLGKFKLQHAGKPEVRTYSYSALLVPVACQLKIRMEDESTGEQRSAGAPAS